MPSLDLLGGSDLPDVPSALGRRVHAEGALHHAWTLMEIRFVVHLEARRNPKKISKQDRLDESEACLKMFIAAVRDCVPSIAHHDG